ncbi:DNA repair helicase [Punctularia strigosozonata HHB-11173 SS5]|uniref:DNA repair helicase n=1 Tax=Punctularia strigosozonata (strain HHB-11173) TaxID=741275 RepID=UPI000441850B|nr:DNA repair helicase [Punctularia strigosozonata HHB-11173 SS5]EIN12348.1 DNA repair helicase [Punctularia strigosozonata HHB-11173 SS5]
MSLQLLTPDQFEAFPYQPPYPNQQELMKHLYSVLEHRRHTIVESRTSTGKTLVLLCATLSWLLDDRDRARQGQLESLKICNSQDPDWIVEQTIERRRKELEADDEAYEARLAELRQNEAARTSALNSLRARKRLKASESSDNVVDVDEQDFLPEDDEESSPDGLNISPAVRALMNKLSGGTASAIPEAPPTCTKVYYASRTHSQLSQIIPELRKLKLRPASNQRNDRPRSHHPISTTDATSKRKSSEDEPENEELVTHVRSLSLGSRKQLCIYDELRSKTTDIDEACRTLLSEKGDKRCPYLPAIDDNTRIPKLRDIILSSPMDIEDLANAGRRHETCPYFGSRSAIPQSQLVLLPYNLLLHRSAREALGIDLKDQVVVIDEAHNLIPTLLSLSSVQVAEHTIRLSLSQLAAYVSRFRSRLASKHLVCLKRLVSFLKAMYGVVNEFATTGAKEPQGPLSKPEVMTVHEFVSRLGRKVDGINLLEVEEYLRRSKIARKISSYSDAVVEKQGPKRSNAGAPTPLHVVESLIVALTSPNEDGRVSLSRVHEAGHDTVVVRYQQLNPSTHFKEVVDTARTVILAGGTMSPMSDYVTQLFPQIKSDNLMLRTYGHIVPASNIQTVVVSKGPRGNDFEFKFASRRDPLAIAELGQALSNLINITPGGMVIFFPSYAFLDSAKASWRESGLLAKWTTKKKVHYEPQSASEVETVLRDYASDISRIDPSTSKKQGAILLAVVGAKLSEGLNFADDLARCVVIVGLPFANLDSPELKERMKYVNSLETANGGKASGAKDAAHELYENMCMNAVNQSIGRAIRHRADWASIVLLDRRYSSPRIRSKLPKWLGDSTVVPQTFGQVIKEMSLFYRNKRND